MILVYKGEGVSPISLKHTIKMLRNKTSRKVLPVTHDKLSETSWMDRSKLLVIPGGRDIPYHKNISPQAIKNIQDFVKNGGAYLGICAGAYFASSEVEFSKGDELEVCESRDLKFFSGIAVGPLFGPYSYEGHASAQAINIHTLDKEIYTLYFNGGCYFKEAKIIPTSKVLAFYENNESAIILGEYGKGKVLLSGVHFEYDAAYLNENDPHLQKILPHLKSANVKREKLVESLLQTLIP